MKLIIQHFSPNSQDSFFLAHLFFLFFTALQHISVHNKFLYTRLTMFHLNLTCSRYKYIVKLNEKESVNGWTKWKKKRKAKVKKKKKKNEQNMGFLSQDSVQNCTFSIIRNKTEKVFCMHEKEMNIFAAIFLLRYECSVHVFFPFFFLFFPPIFLHCKKVYVILRTKNLTSFLFSLKTETTTTKIKKTNFYAKKTR